MRDLVNLFRDEYARFSTGCVSRREPAVPRSRWAFTDGWHPYSPMLAPCDKALDYEQRLRSCAVPAPPPIKILYHPQVAPIPEVVADAAESSQRVVDTPLREQRAECARLERLADAAMRDMDERAHAAFYQRLDWYLHTAGAGDP